jgi:hypothetical protein
MIFKAHSEFDATPAKIASIEQDLLGREPGWSRSVQSSVESVTPARIAVGSIGHDSVIWVFAFTTPKFGPAADAPATRGTVSGTVALSLPRLEKMPRIIGSIARLGT